MVSDIRKSGKMPGLSISEFPGHTRSFLKIQDGCDSGCSYCIVPSVRGSARSLPVDEVLKQAGRLSAGGYREIVLCGIHLGMYGRDLSPHVSFFDLLRKMAMSGFAHDCRIRLSSIEPA